MFRYLFLCCLLLVAAPAVFAQQYLLPNEEPIFSFDTRNGKKVMLAKDKCDAYIIYRFGTAGKIEFEFPGAKHADSWQQFKYAFWLRGGGTQNEGIDLNYVSFINKGYTYVIYDTYRAVGNLQQIGVKVINNTTKKETDIPGKAKTRKGNLVDLRENERIGKGDELF